jgi:hypothetical protein
MPAAAQVADRVQLGVMAPGDTLTIRIDRLVAPTRITVEIDGVAVETQVAVNGPTLVLRLPDDLRGARHDIVVYENSATGRERIGTWEFETSPAGWDVFASVVTEAGVRASRDRSETFATAGGRIDFDRGQGRFRGGLSFALDSTAADDERLSIGDWFLETRGTLAGEDLTTRLGNHTLYSGGNLVDETSRRGASVRLGDPSGRYDASAFVLKPDYSTRTVNLTGLTDTDDRVAGFLTGFHPVAGGSTRIGLGGTQAGRPACPTAIRGRCAGRAFPFRDPWVPGAPIMPCPLIAPAGTAVRAGPKATRPRPR